MLQSEHKAHSRNLGKNGPVPWVSPNARWWGGGTKPGSRLSRHGESSGQRRALTKPTNQLPAQPLLHCTLNICMCCLHELLKTQKISYLVMEKVDYMAVIISILWLKKWRLEKSYVFIPSKKWSLKTGSRVLVSQYRVLWVCGPHPIAKGASVVAWTWMNSPCRLTTYHSLHPYYIAQKKMVENSKDP